jgi:hypothetical protein
MMVMKLILCLLFVPLCSCFINNDYEYEKDVKKLEEEKGIKNEINNVSVNAITEAEQLKNTSSFVKEAWCRYCRYYCLAYQTFIQACA